MLTLLPRQLTRFVCAAGANASRGLTTALTDSTPAPEECLPPADADTEACLAEYHTWCDGSCKNDDYDDTLCFGSCLAGCEALCAPNPANGNAIECTPSLPDDQLPCFAARSPEDYPGVTYTSVKGGADPLSNWYAVVPCVWLWDAYYGWYCT